VQTQDVDPAELQLFRDTVRKFAADEIEPYYEQWEKDEIFPRELWHKMGEAGLLCADVPEAYGGIGATFRFSSAIVEELCRLGFNSIGVSVSVHSDIIAHYIVNHGTEAQKQHYLPKMVTGECIGAIGMTEPGAGSDVQAIRTQARRDGDGFLIDGQKTFITNGQHCDLVVLAARTNMQERGAKGTTLFLADADNEGFQRGRNLEKIGLHASDTSELFFADMHVGEDKILGELDRGFMLLMQELPRERLILCSSAVAAVEGALDWTIEYTHERKAFGAPIAKLQNTRFEIAEMIAKAKAARAFWNECTELFERGELDAATAAMLKQYTTDLQCEVCDRCLQLFGGYGYMREYPISRAYVDARVQRIYGGTNEIMKELAARAILGR